jgi:non-specific serine/threonine protein kinase
MASPTAFGLWLKQQRQDRKLPRKELAAAIDCSEVVIVKIEGGTRRPSRQIAELLAAYFGVPAAEWPAFETFARADLPAYRLAQLTADRGLPPWRQLARRPHNLPIPPTSFIGRAALLGQASALLHDPAVRLLTLTGPPGVGKTRTALRLAEDGLADFADGVCFVPLAAIRDPALVLPAIAQAFELREGSDRPLRRRVQDHLRDRQLLLVLDNFEQVLPAAPLVAALLEAGAGVKILATSRAALHLYGEYELPVPPLPLPAPPLGEALAYVGRYDAVRLFVERAGAAVPGFRLGPGNAQAVAEICVQLDGLPLALELAAARVKTLSVEAIRAQMEQRLLLLTNGPVDHTPRQQTLRGAIEWSYDLLAPAERALFCGLAVFAGGCTLEAVERVCGPGGAGPSPRPRRAPSPIPALLASLVAKSLLREESSGPTRRFEMLETLREYAGERLAASGEAPERQRQHLHYYLELAEQAEYALQGPQQVAWLDRLEVEHDNVRAALDWALAQGATTAALRIGGAIWRFWVNHGHLEEGRRWMDRALAQAADPATQAGPASADLPDAGPVRAWQAKALKAAGNLAQTCGDHPAARRLLEESLAHSRQLGDARGIAAALNNLGNVARAQGDYTYAVALLEESLAWKRRLGDRAALASSLSNLGIVVKDQGDHARAGQLYAESLAIWRELGDEAGIAGMLNNLGIAAFTRGSDNEARAFYAEGLALRRHLGDKHGMAAILLNLGSVEWVSGHYPAARSLFAESLKLRTELGDLEGVANSLHHLGYTALREGDAGQAATLFRESLRLHRDGGRKRGIAECLGGLAAVALAEGHPAQAAQLLGALEALREAIGLVLHRIDQTEYDRNLALVRGQLDAPTFAAAWQQGQHLDVIVASALRDFVAPTLL